MNETYVRLARADTVPDGEVRVFDVGVERIALCNVKGSFYAIENTCTHDDGPLGEGTLDGAEVVCPRHGARFDVRSGAVTRMPAVQPVRTFPVRVEGTEIYVRIGGI